MGAAPLNELGTVLPLNRQTTTGGIDNFAAQGALRSPARSLEQVAMQVGYADRATLAKLFKQLCGETPGAFRKRLQQPLTSGALDLA